MKGIRRRRDVWLIIFLDGLLFIGGPDKTDFSDAHIHRNPAKVRFDPTFLAYHAEN